MYPARNSRECTQISNDGVIRNYSADINMQARPRRYAFCNDPWFTFSVSPSLSFIFICTFHWCKHCIVIEVTTNVRRLTITALCEIAEDGVVCGTFLVGTLFAPTQALHFQALHPLSILFICTLHWCKHCTVQEITTNMRKFPMTSLCGIAANGHICRSVFVGALLDRHRVYIFSHSIPLASFSYAPFIGASIAQ